ncbi:MAG: hypothetical protein ACRYG5_19220 [Janthinobacterium lividum]
MSRRRQRAALLAAGLLLGPAVASAEWSLQATGGSVTSSISAMTAPAQAGVARLQAPIDRSLTVPSTSDSAVTRTAVGRASSSAQATINDYSPFIDDK